MKGSGFRIQGSGPLARRATRGGPAPGVVGGHRRSRLYEALAAVRCTLPTICFIFLAALSCPAAAQTKPPPSLDEELMKDLGRDPLEKELFGEKKDPAEKPAGDKDTELRTRVIRELGKAAEAEDDHPLLALARRMREAEGRIAAKDPGEKTQALQAAVLADLDQLIEQARKSCKRSGSRNQTQMAMRSGSGGGTPKDGSKNPSDKSSTAGPRKTDTPAKQGDIGQVIESMKKNVWGNLPVHARNIVMDLPAEAFLPKYQALIEEYFRRLSEGNRRE